MTKTPQIEALPGMTPLGIKPKPRRFANALAIQEGACNPSGIAYSLVEAFQEIAAENGDTNAKRTDPAIRLIVHQLAYLCGVAEIDSELDVYSQLVAACEARRAA